MKRFFTFFVALLSACTFSAYAAIVDGTCGDNLTWTLNTKDSTLVISGEGEMDSYIDMHVFPSWIEYKSYIKHVTIQDSVTSIGDYTFYLPAEYENIRSITLGNSVKTIGSDAFSSCPSLTSVTIPNSVTSIGGSAFSGCSSLTSITIPNSVTSIEHGVFSSCSALTSVTIPNSVTSIGDWAFFNCSGLTSVTIPNSVTSIGAWAFYECSGLTSIAIPDSVTSIGNYAFDGCSGLTSITIPNSVTSIGKSVFYDCSSLTSITIPNSVTSIGESAFSSCKGLTFVTIGNSVTSIGSDAFRYCSNIQEVTAYMPTPIDAKDCGINPAAATLYVPAEYLDIYSNTLWWEDFAKIRAIGSDWDVEFVDWDGTVLATMKVPNGEAATAPADPTREGYTFIGWDKDFSAVTDHMTVTAQYQINRYRVRFFDFNDTLLHTDSVEYQAAAVAPANPYRTGYTFTGWDKAFDSITADLDVYAQYEMGEDYDMTIVFTNSEDNDSEIYSQSLTIKVPAAPEIEGFTFLGWQPVATLITDTITIQAIYEADVPSSAPEVYVNPVNPAQKLLRNGQVYILQDGQTYTITGQRF